MSTEEIKLQIFRQVDALDANKLKEFYGVMLNYVNSKKDTDDWIGVNKAEQAEIEAAIKELKDGKGISHQQVMTKLRNKFTDA